MKFELTVTDEVLVELFLVDYADEEMQRRKQRLNRHTLLMNKSLRQYWEQKMTERGFGSTSSF